MAQPSSPLGAILQYLAAVIVFIITCTLAFVELHNSERFFGGVLLLVAAVPFYFATVALGDALKDS